VRQRRYYFFSALLSGVLLALSLPDNVGWVPLIFAAWVPLLLAEERFHTSNKAERPRNFMPYVLLAMAVWNACTTWWLYWVSEPMESKLFAVIGPNIGNDLLFCLPWLVMRWARWFVPGRYVRWMLVVAWIAFERFHMNWDLSWPWLTLGNVFAEHPAWVQWYEITGHLGGSLWVWVVNLGLFSAFRVQQNENSVRSAVHKARVAALLIAVPVLASWLRYATFTEEGTPLEIVVVQPNMDPYNQKFSADPLAQLDTMLAQAERLVTPRTALVIMPETSLQELPSLEDGAHGELVFHGLWENALDSSESVHRIHAFLQKHPGTSLVSGMSSAYLYPKGTDLPISARMIDRLDRGYDSYNSALLVRPDGSTESYMKSKLVPGVELLPFEEVLGPISAIALDLGGTTGSLGTQEEREVLSTADGRVRFAPVICYESIYGDHVAAHVRNGAEFIAIMTNDAWWGDSPAYRQHLAFGRLRAVETRRSIARSANTGISCFVDQRGDVHDPTEWWVADARKGTVLARKDLTFFAQHGDLIGTACSWLCAAVLLGLLGLALRRRFAG
jgi:apolipoprotein N-acyltransferase